MTPAGVGAAVDEVDAVVPPMVPVGVGANPAKVLNIVASDVEFMPAGSSGAAHAFIHALIGTVAEGAERQGKKHVPEPTTVEEVEVDAVDGADGVVGAAVVVVVGAAAADNAILGGSDGSVIGVCCCKNAMPVCVFIGAAEMEKGNSSETEGEEMGIVAVAAAAGIDRTAIAGAFGMLVARAARLGVLASAATPACPGSLILLNTSPNPVGIVGPAVAALPGIIGEEGAVGVEAAAGAMNVCHGVLTTGLSCCDCCWLKMDDAPLAIE